ncbi:MAG: preprotein translocase subunit SecA [Calditrichaeota bacterium]|nr:MAG: preprotein translocase subunit SecA [Calditrichota bacterium]
MINTLLEKVFGNKHEKDVKKIEPIVAQINEIYPALESLSDDELKAKTTAFKEKINAATSEVRSAIEKLEILLRDEEAAEKSEYISSDDIRANLAEQEEEELEIIADVLDEILPEAFAVVKDTCRRLIGKEWDVMGQKTRWDMVPYDVQLIGGIVLHQGKIAEMATGEGKTLVATMPLYLNALAGKGAHLVTVNDYLAQRDCEWMGKIFEFLGLTSDYITNDLDPSRRNVAYDADITYGTNNEFGFDYLRDNMAGSMDDQVQRKHHYAIIDEVDSVLVDEARTPLIISGPVESSNQQYQEMKPRVERLVRNQTMMVNKMVAEGEKLLNDGEEYEAGVQLLRASRGAPKNKRLMKLLNEKGVKKLIRSIESEFIRDKRMSEIDEELYFAIDEKAHTIDLMDKGRENMSPNDPNMFVLPDLSEAVGDIEKDESLSDAEKIEKREALHRDYSERADQLHSISQLLRAYSLFEKDVEYVVSDDNKVMIVDEFTGRLMTGRRYSDGLHQAIEAKEGVKIERETQTMATITLQNYFRMYNKLAGMTGTAETESSEFWEIYKLDVVVIPTNRPITRVDHEDFVYRTKREKFNAVIGEIDQLHKQRLPILVGTTSVDESETLSRMLKRKGIKHNVLNAKQHKREAEIIAHAGQLGAVTIATNMAGRGTDIKLGAGVVVEGNPESGLQIVGTGRHEARRIDRQLRGRAGRQGDPGSSRFFLSLEDDLMRLFQSDRVASVMDRLGLEDGEVITHGMVTKSIERAQKRVEAHNFDIRKHLLEYDNVMNQQREVIYDRRNHALRGENLKEEINDLISEQVDAILANHLPEDSYADDWDLAGLRLDFQKMFLVDWPLSEEDADNFNAEEIVEKLHAAAAEAYDNKEKSVTSQIMRQMERFAMLQTIDAKWRDHLYEMDQIKEGIGLRAYGQKDPLIEYKSEGFRAFKQMIDDLNREVLELLFKMQVHTEQSAEIQRRQQMLNRLTAMHQDATGMGMQGGGQSPQNAPVAGKRKPVVVEDKVGRNDPCPCGSGKKYKKCHGAVN